MQDKVAATQPQFEIQRIYVKDVSFEAPNTPHTFMEEWKPEVSLNLETKSSRVQDNVHEVIISITATVSTGKKSAFLIEIQQAGIFLITGVANDQLHHMLGSFCPNILFPYAREVISDMVMRAGFPQLILAPVNFDALYAQHMEEQKKQGTHKEGEDTQGGKVH
ncbi:MAG: protein-export chaperone SecB [Gammaproteobacteria bacterium RIFCSPHIGHO2_12_FULL_41_20]|nr:MAG: protein-export chaperone SecB [Gammaproteobacteria bacterium RIFCSPHIGHO2_12_FULL_41_20]